MQQFHKPRFCSSVEFLTNPLHDSFPSVLIHETRRYVSEDIIRKPAQASTQVHKTTKQSARSACMDLWGVNFRLIKPTYNFLVAQTDRM